MSKIPKYLTDRNEWEVQDFINHARTGELPVNPTWTAARDEALEDAGIDLDDDGPVPVEEMSVQQHFDRIQRNRLP
ncbi:MAG: hypothetical protein J0H06_09630 [Actinobacteria bacterium]|nr:hypothetical protein [Actinomycetota bacterium]OJU83502.1 MAG: hypothetical protein BGO11_13350 [Solirubrobacterales bacterium 70-9]